VAVSGGSPAADAAEDQQAADEDEEERIKRAAAEAKDQGDSVIRFAEELAEDANRRVGEEALACEATGLGPHDIGFPEAPLEETSSSAPSSAAS